MQTKKYKRLLCVCLLCLMVLTPLSVFAKGEEPVRFCYTDGTINFRKTPDFTSGSKYHFQIGKHQALPVFDEVQGASYNGSTLWYRVAYTYKPDGEEYVGYVHSKVVNLCTPIEYGTDSFSEFPESYRPYLAALRAAHPTWTFLPLDTERDFAAAVAEQAVVTKSGNTLTSPSFVDKSFSVLYRSTAVVGGLDASVTLVDGGTRYCASEGAIAHYMDPRTSLNEVDIFMFSHQAYDESVHTPEGTQAMLEGTNMESAEITDPEGNTVTYASAFLDAAKKTGISPYYLILTSVSENGTGGTNLSKGNLSGGVCENADCSDLSHRGYYNFYGIGANSTGSPQHNALLYAIDRGWNSAYKAIVGGAEFLGGNYITKGQQTPYLQKFNVNPASPYPIWHQYMQNIQRPRIEAYEIFTSIREDGLLEAPHTFLIPVFDNLPKEPCALPTWSSLAAPLWGDADDDEKIDLADVVLLSQYLAEFDWDTGTSPVTVGEGADANADEAVDLSDLVLLCQYLADYDWDTGDSTVVLGPKK